jgi:hypothetical protein
MARFFNKLNRPGPATRQADCRKNRSAEASTAGRSRWLGALHRRPRYLLHLQACGAPAEDEDVAVGPSARRLIPTKAGGMFTYGADPGWDGRSSFAAGFARRVLRATTRLLVGVRRASERSDAAPTPTRAIGHASCASTTSPATAGLDAGYSLSRLARAGGRPTPPVTELSVRTRPS